MRVCAVCRDARTFTGTLCEECAASIRGAGSLCADKIQIETTSAEGGEPTGASAGIIDRWGRVHSLPFGHHVVVGRDLGCTLRIAESSVSRRHAELFVAADGPWTVLDVGSRNGTFVDDVPVSEPVRLRSGAVVFFGQVGLYFVTPLPAPLSEASPPPLTTVPPPEEGTLGAGAGDGGAGDLAETFAGLRTVDMALSAPRGGGGGVIEVEGKIQHLTSIQYELLSLLADRMSQETGKNERVRGFVRSSELCASLPWDTARPEDNHIKQLVRRVRRALLRAGIDDLIESRQGFGYRLRVKQRSPTARGVAP